MQLVSRTARAACSTEGLACAMIATGQERHRMDSRRDLIITTLSMDLPREHSENCNRHLYLKKVSPLSSGESTCIENQGSLVTGIHVRHLPPKFTSAMVKIRPDSTNLDQHRPPWTKRDLLGQPRGEAKKTTMWAGKLPQEGFGGEGTGGSPRYGPQVGGESCRHSHVRFPST